jgi:hypothetical protein
MSVANFCTLKEMSKKNLRKNSNFTLVPPYKHMSLDVNGEPAKLYLLLLELLLFTNNEIYQFWKSFANTVFSPIEPLVALFFSPKILKIFTLLPPDARQEKGVALLARIR